MGCFYDGYVSVPKERMDKANKISVRSILVQNLCTSRPAKFKPSEDNDGKACSDIDEVTEYSNSFYVGDNIEELCDEFLDHADNLLFLLPEDVGIIDASDEELIAEQE